MEYELSEIDVSFNVTNSDTQNQTQNDVNYENLNCDKRRASFHTFFSQNRPVLYLKIFDFLSRILTNKVKLY